MKKFRVILRNALGRELDSIEATTNAEVQLAILTLVTGTVFSAGDTIAVEGVTQ